MARAKGKIDVKKLRSWKLLDDFRRRLAKVRGKMPPPPDKRAGGPERSAKVRNIPGSFTAGATSMPNSSGVKKKGGRISYGGDAEFISGTIAAIEAPKALVHAFKFAGSDAPENQVAYRIKPVGESMCSLTISPVGFRAKDQAFADITGGWPVIASSLKTLLETGRTLPWPPKANLEAAP